MKRMLTRIANPFARMRGCAHGRAAASTLAISALTLSQLCICICIGGCSRENAEGNDVPSVPPPPLVERRMKDPEYVKQLDSLRAEQQEISRRLAEAKAALEAARAGDPEGAKTKELEKNYNAVAKELDVHRAKAMLAVRSRMLKDDAADKAAAKNAKASTESR